MIGRGATAIVRTPVLIVGGGGCGLSASIFLSDFGVEHLLVERHDGTSILPKASGYSQRTMEIYRRHGIADAIYAQGAPPEQACTAAFYTSLLGDGPLDRRLLYKTDVWGLGGQTRERYDRDGPSRCALLPQWDLEPLLRAAATGRNPGRINFGHQLLTVEQAGDLVRARVRDLADGSEYDVHADYLIAADGGRCVGPQLGIALEGPTDLADMVSIVFDADLGPRLPEDDVLLYYFSNPGGTGYQGGGVLSAQPYGAGKHGGWGRSATRWRLNVQYAAGDPMADLDADRAATVVRQLLHDDDLELAVTGINHWVLEGVVAKQFRFGRVFVAGDAAHRQPPQSGLGLNSAIQDAHNLAWKLAAVLAGWASQAVLDTYEAERRPVDSRQVEYALHAFRSLGLLIAAGSGVHPADSPDDRARTFAALLADTPDGRTRRAILARVWSALNVEFQAHDIDLGYSYDQGAAVVADGSPPPARDPMGYIYVPTTRPGHRLPHAWLRHGTRHVSTLDLVPLGGFALLTSRADAGWQNAAREVATTLGVPVEAFVIDSEHGYDDLDGTWARLREVDPDGAVLVRPDNFVAWRMPRAPADPARALRDAMEAVLARRGDHAKAPSTSKESGVSSEAI